MLSTCEFVTHIARACHPLNSLNDRTLGVKSSRSVPKCGTQPIPGIPMQQLPLHEQKHCIPLRVNTRFLASPGMYMLAAHTDSNSRHPRANSTGKTSPYNRMRQQCAQTQIAQLTAGDLSPSDLRNNQSSKALATATEFRCL
jgi:hypothetical protein